MDHHFFEILYFWEGKKLPHWPLFCEAITVCYVPKIVLVLKKSLTGTQTG